MSGADKISLDLECDKCGGTVSLPENYTEDSMMTCNDCGIDIGIWRDIQAQIRERVKLASVKAIKDALKRK